MVASENEQDFDQAVYYEPQQQVRNKAAVLPRIHFYDADSQRLLTQCLPVFDEQYHLIKENNENENAGDHLSTRPVNEQGSDHCQNHWRDQIDEPI